jgi:Type IV secretion-system coupling protein DNA-binding domain
VRGTYGDAEAQTLVENCGNTLILRCSASERGGTSEFDSRLIGKREIVRQQRTRSRGGFFGGGAEAKDSITEQHVTRKRSWPPRSSSTPISPVTSSLLHAQNGCASCYPAPKRRGLGQAPWSAPQHKRKVSRRNSIARLYASRQWQEYSDLRGG